MSYDVVIRGGTVATAADTYRADVGIRDGRIVAIADSLADAREVIDAGGLLVLPGGIDSHVHIEQPGGDGSMTADDFESGTRSAACGGTTTIMPFAMQFRGRSLRETTDAYRRKAEGKAMIDYAIHLIIADPTDQVIGQDLPALIKDGYTSFKVYMTYDDLKLNDRQMLDVLSLARREGAMTMIHAENSDCISWLTARLAATGRTGPRYHCTSRPMPVEREASHRAIALAELLDTPMLLVHVSGREAVDEIRRAQARGLKVYGETCPQYLFLEEANLAMPGFMGAMCVCSPPPRDRANQAAMWDALAGGVFQVVSSDHCPYRFNDPKGKMIAGPNAPFWKIPNGIPGIETRLPLLFDGVSKGRITLQQFVALSATNQARIYGLDGRKGAIAVGADADIALWDPKREVTIRNEDLHHNVDYTPYEGITVTGWPVHVLSRGTVVVRDGRPLGRKGHGEFLRCRPPEAAKPAGRRVVPAELV
ncbi:MAG: dihydropyrimidinase [Alphaproteobacteria bacterium]|nr:dihydropyrimidinase [Alphaproteobacteria bacterium]